MTSCTQNVRGRVLLAQEMLEERQRLRERSETLAFANGHFDLVHVGHLRYLEASAAEADHLLVAINSDASCARLKGAGRPIVPELERAELLSGLRVVDYVVIFDADSPDQLLQELKPDVHCKGTDYGVPENVPEFKIVQAYGGRTAIVGDPKDHNTSDLIAQIRKLPD